MDKPITIPIKLSAGLKYCVNGVCSNVKPKVISSGSAVPVHSPPLTLSPPLYTQLWFVPLIAGIAILGFLGFKRFRL
ncbi:hypothetical protein DJ529_12570 [Sulfolobus sp. C3]|nr:hypothetical protein DJ529_12570 [Sulfolobus sp. C3]